MPSLKSAPKVMNAQISKTNWNKLSTEYWHRNFPKPENVGAKVNSTLEDIIKMQISQQKESGTEYGVSLQNLFQHFFL